MISRSSTILVCAITMFACSKSAGERPAADRESPEHPVYLDVSIGADGRIYADHRFVSFDALDSILRTLQVTSDTVTIYREIGVNRPGSRGDSLFKRVRDLVKHYRIPFDVSDTARYFSPLGSGT